MTNLDDREKRHVQIFTDILDEVHHVILVRLSVFESRCVALSLIPEQRFDLAAALQRLFGSVYHVLVQGLPACPLFDGGAADRARHQPHLADALSDDVGERHPRPDAAGLFDVNVGVERLVSGLPVELRAEAEDGGVWAAFRRNHPVPFVVVVDAATAGHVALAGEDKDLHGRAGLWPLPRASGSHR